MALELVGDPAPTGDIPIDVGNGSPAVAKPAVMADISPPGSPMALELVDYPAPAGDMPIDAGNGSPAVAKPAVTAGMTSPDRFLAVAIREHEEGCIDQPLWARAVVQARGDETLAIAAYLRARATALQLIKRDERRETSDGRTRASRTGVTSTNADRIVHDNAKPRVRFRTMMAAMLGSLVVVVGLLGTYRASNSAQPPNDAGGAPAAPLSGPASRTIKPLVASNNAAIDAVKEDPSREFMTRIQELKDARNWNVVVLIASAWTRKEPGNAAAWNELSIGYVNMRQLDDAHAAATKAVQLAPKDALLWRNLGQLALDLNEPVEALRAYEEATRWNDKDTYSFVQAGILNARLNRLPEAKLAFAKALALNPENADAQCGEAWIAQRQARPKEVNATAMQAMPPDGKCRDLIEPKNVAVASKGPTAFKVVPSRGR
jgi:cytochrome c-type biogenesis protein CcmH/NrfG